MLVSIRSTSILTFFVAFRLDVASAMDAMDESEQVLSTTSPAALAAEGVESPSPQQDAEASVAVRTPDLHGEDGLASAAELSSIELRSFLMQRGPGSVLAELDRVLALWSNGSPLQEPVALRAFRAEAETVLSQNTENRPKTELWGKSAEDRAQGRPGPEWRWSLGVDSYNRHSPSGIGAVAKQFVRDVFEWGVATSERLQTFHGEPDSRSRRRGCHDILREWYADVVNTHISHFSVKTGYLPK